MTDLTPGHPGWHGSLEGEPINDTPTPERTDGGTAWTGHSRWVRFSTIRAATRKTLAVTDGRVHMDLAAAEAENAKLRAALELIEECGDAHDAPVARRTPPP